MNTLVQKENQEITLPGQRINRIIPQRKLEYADKLKGLLSEYNTCLIVTIKNVGSKQIADMRKDFRGKARFLFGKNTLIRKVIRDYMKETGNQKLFALLDLIRGNCGFCFTNADINTLRKDIISRQVQTAARPGIIAPVDVFVTSGPTNMEPTLTAFFQTMGIPTRINKGQIDIISDVKVITAGEKVNASQSTLLSKLNIKPFYYGMKVASIYEDGNAYEASVLDISSSDVANAFCNGLRQIAALCLAINHPTIISVPHNVLNSYKKILGLGLSLNTYSWDKLAQIKEMLANPQAFAAAQTTVKKDDTKPNVVAEPEPEEEKESEKAVDMFGNEEEESD